MLLRTLGPMLVILALGACGAPAPRVAADTVYLGRIITLDPAHPQVQALAVSGDRLVAVGTEAEVDAEVGGAVRRVTLDGVAVPGLTDAHVHVMMFGEQLKTLDLRGLAKDGSSVASPSGRAPRRPAPGSRAAAGTRGRGCRWRFPPRPISTPQFQTTRWCSAGSTRTRSG